jgi:hypothetical protein
VALSEIRYTGIQCADEPADALGEALTAARGHLQVFSQRCAHDLRSTPSRMTRGTLESLRQILRQAHSELTVHALHCNALQCAAPLAAILRYLISIDPLISRTACDAITPAR